MQVTPIHVISAARTLNRVGCSIQWPDQWSTEVLMTLDAQVQAHTNNPSSEIRNAVASFRAYIQEQFQLLIQARSSRSKVSQFDVPSPSPSSSSPTLDGAHLRSLIQLLVTDDGWALGIKSGDGSWILLNQQTQGLTEEWERLKIHSLAIRDPNGAWYELGSVEIGALEDTLSSTSTVIDCRNSLYQKISEINHAAAGFKAKHIGRLVSNLHEPNILVRLAAAQAIEIYFSKLTGLADQETWVESLINSAEHSSEKIRVGGLFTELAPYLLEKPLETTVRFMNANPQLFKNEQAHKIDEYARSQMARTEARVLETRLRPLTEQDRSANQALQTALAKELELRGEDFNFTWEISRYLWNRNIPITNSERKNPTRIVQSRLSAFHPAAQLYTNLRRGVMPSALELTRARECLTIPNQPFHPNQAFEQARGAITKRMEQMGFRLKK